jgi:nitrogen fixation/metabolism regulation signal transduction histidine kinase
MVAPGLTGPPAPKPRWRGIALVVLWAAVGVGALLLLAKSVQNSGEFSRLQPWILLLNVVGVVALTVLLARKLTQLVRDYRAHVPGSRLTARTVAIFGALVVAPLLIVYLFSLQFLNRGIDSWFHVEVKQGLNDALVLSRAALDLRVREYSRHTENLAHSLANATAEDVAERVYEERRATAALEMAVYGSHERIVTAAMENPLESLPTRPPPDLVRQVGERRAYVSLEPQAGGEYLIRTAAPFSDSPARADDRYLVALYEVPTQLAALSEAVQRAYSQYGELAALREPLKSSFRLTLTLVLLLAMLAAIYGAIFSAQRLVRPVQDLIEGTRAVGKGDFGTRLPLPSRDEMGFLVHSFNDMTKRLRRAREEATRSQRVVERERERLAIILARLSTGVVVVDRELTVSIANQAAGAILGTDLSAATGRALPQLTAGNERLGQFVAALVVRFGAGREEWREQLDLDGASGRRTLMCACTPQPGADRSGLCHRLRRHHDAVAGAARCRLGRGRAASRARDQESADTDSALGGAHAAALSLQHVAAGRGSIGARHAHDRAAGRNHAADGERIQRIRARAGDAHHALQLESARERSRRPVPLARSARGDPPGARRAHRRHRSGPRARAPDPQQPRDQCTGSPRRRRRAAARDRDALRAGGGRCEIRSRHGV